MRNPRTTLLMMRRKNFKIREIIIIDRELPFIVKHLSTNLTLKYMFLFYIYWTRHLLTRLWKTTK